MVSGLRKCRIYSLPSRSATALTLAVNELVPNALKHAFVGREEGRITVTLRNRPPGFEIEVQDDGVGLSPDEPPLRGLGLQIIDTLVGQDLGGQLRVERGERGTCATICVPGPVSVEGTVKSLRILLAEDESIIRLGLCRILEEAGHQVVAAPDGRTAVKLATQTGPDLTILDIKMPGMDGLEAAQAIYSRRPIPIVLLTAYGDRELIEQAAGLPIMAYLIKPVNEQELLATVEVVTTRFAEQQQSLRQAAELEERLATRTAVERAKGVLMQREGLCELWLTRTYN